MRGRRVVALVATAVLVGCGGGASLEAPAPDAVVNVTGPGRLLAATVLPSISAAQVSQALAAAGIAHPVHVPRYDVDNVRIEYLTLDVDGREIRASGLVSVPRKGAGARSPVLSYQHGTIFRDAEAPSNAILPDEPTVAMASLGYVVVAADYVGYGASKGTAHPYLLSAPAAAAVLDLLTASRTWRLRNGVVANGQLLMAGYSEGGYVTMAAHRALEAGSSVHRSELVTVVPGAGPYNLQVTLDELLARIKDENAFLGALIEPGFLRHLGSTIRNEVRRLLVRQLVPGDADVPFDTKFIDAFLDDDRELIERQSNVHDWKPELRTRLYHGRDDQTVPYASSASTLAAMRARGAADVSLTDCTVSPSGHRDCVLPYWAFMLDALQERARDL